MRRTYSATFLRATVNLDQKGHEQFEWIQNQLVDHYNFRSKPSLSLILGVALARLVNDDPRALQGLRQEVEDAATTKHHFSTNTKKEQVS
jgi:hypothetical protein